MNAFRLNAFPKVNVQFLRKVAEYFSSVDLHLSILEFMKVCISCYRGVQYMWFEMYQ